MGRQGRGGSAARAEGEGPGAGRKKLAGARHETPPTPLSADPLARRPPTSRALPTNWRDRTDARCGRSAARHTARAAFAFACGTSTARGGAILGCGCRGRGCAGAALTAAFLRCCGAVPRYQQAAAVSDAVARAGARLVQWRCRARPPSCHVLLVTGGTTAAAFMRAAGLDSARLRVLLPGKRLRDGDSRLAEGGTWAE